MTTLPLSPDPGAHHGSTSTVLIGDATGAQEHSMHAALAAAAEDPVNRAIARVLLTLPLLGARDVATMVGVHAATAWRHFQRLERLGLVETLVPPMIGRANARLAYLTPTGLRLAVPQAQTPAAAQRIARAWGADLLGLAHLVPRLPAYWTLQQVLPALRTVCLRAVSQRFHYPVAPALGWRWGRGYRHTFVSRGQTTRLAVDGVWAIRVVPYRAVRRTASVQHTWTSMRNDEIGHAEAEAEGAPELTFALWILLDPGVGDERVLAPRLEGLLRYREAPEHWARPADPEPKTKQVLQHVTEPADPAEPASPARHLASMLPASTTGDGALAFPPVLIFVSSIQRAQCWQLAAREAARRLGADSLQGHIAVGPPKAGCAWPLGIPGSPTLGDGMNAAPRVIDLETGSQTQMETLFSRSVPIAAWPPGLLALPQAPLLGRGGHPAIVPRPLREERLFVSWEPESQWNRWVGSDDVSELSREPVPAAATSRSSARGGTCSATSGVTSMPPRTPTPPATSDVCPPQRSVGSASVVVPRAPVWHALRQERSCELARRLEGLAQRVEAPATRALLADAQRCLVMPRTQVQLLDTLAAHPLLCLADLALFFEWPATTVERRLRPLRRAGLIEQRLLPAAPIRLIHPADRLAISVTKAGVVSDQTTSAARLMSSQPAQPERSSRRTVADREQEWVDDSLECRCFRLTADGWRLFTAVVGVPRARLAPTRLGAAATGEARGASAGTDDTAPPSSQRPAPATEVDSLLRTPAHTAGIYRFFATLALSARAARARDDYQELLWWETGTRCCRWFPFGAHWYALCPDGRGEFAWRGRRIRFWLEWDQGTMNRRDLKEKFATYALYAREGTWRDELPQTPPLVLLVTAGYAQEVVLRRAVRDLWRAGALPPRTPLVLRSTTLDRILLAGSLLGRIWLPLLPIPPAPAALPSSYPGGGQSEARSASSGTVPGGSDPGALVASRVDWTSGEQWTKSWPPLDAHVDVGDDTARIQAAFTDLFSGIPAIPPVSSTAPIVHTTTLQSPGAHGAGWDTWADRDSDG